MKKTNFLLPLITLLVTSCNQEDSVFVESNLSASSELSNVSALELIHNHLHLLGEKCTGTRGTSDLSIDPYIVEGDTVLYIANLNGDGWYLYSAKFQAPMILMYSETGELYPSDAEIPSEISSFIDNLAENVYLAQNNTGYIDDSWNAFLEASSLGIPLIPDTLDHGSNGFQPDPMPYDTIPSDALGDGYWLHDTTYVSKKQGLVDHLITDFWTQKSPYNSYIPYDYSLETPVHSLVGCCALSVGQFLHYLHNKDGITPRAYSTATYDSSINRYRFSNISHTIWDNLDNNHIDSVAMVLGYISNSFSKDFSFEATSANMDTVVQFMRDSCEMNCRLSFFDVNYVVNRIKNHYPVILQGLGKRDTNRLNHCFLADGYYNEYNALQVTHRWVGTDANGNPANDYDSEGNPINCRFKISTIIQSTNTPFLRMHWGYGSSCYYDRLWFNASQTWYILPTYYYYPYKMVEIL